MDKRYMVSINAITKEQGDATRVAEILSRVMVSIALDDVTVSLSVSQIEIEEEEEEESTDEHS